MYVRPRLNGGEPLSFGVSGKLWRDALVMYDRQTHTLWSQVTGEPMVGPTVAIRLAEWPTQLTTWVHWRARHPNTLVLVKQRMKRSAYAAYHRNPHRIGISVAPKGDSRLRPKALVFGIARGDAAVAIPFDRLTESPIQNLVLNGEAMVVFSPAQETNAVAFSSLIDDELLTFAVDSDHDGGFWLKDKQTHSRWHWETGACLTGRLQGKQLRPVAGTPVFWSVWVRYYPESQIYPERPESTVFDP